MRHRHNCPLPADPTPEQITAALAAQEAARQTDAIAVAALRQRILALARSAEGMQVDQLSAGQLRALQYVLLWRGGALDRTGAVRPLGEWARSDPPP